MTLKLGKYLIANKAHGAYLGRGVAEDKSLLPKPIVTLPGGVWAPLWKVEPLKNGYYKLALLYRETPSLETYTVDFRDGVSVIIDPVSPLEPTEWLIKPIKRDGESVYLIESPSGKFWTAPKREPYTHIVLEDLDIFRGETVKPDLIQQLFAFYPEPKEQE